MSAEIPISVQISEVELEIKMRENVYAGLVARGKMKARDKERKIAIMREVLKTLREMCA